MTDERLDPRRIHCALVAMLFDPGYAERVQGDQAIAALSVRERSALRAIDPRALTTDRYRRARAVTVLIQEYPATAAVLGVASFDRFFATEAFRGAVFGRGSMAVAFGAWIGERAHGVGRIESAMAQVRRVARDPAAPESMELGCPPHLRALVVAAGTLAYLGRVLERLGPDPAAALAHRSARTSERAPQRGAEYLLVERRDDGSIDLGTGSEPLVRLLAFASVARSREVLESEAIRQGAAVDEAVELIDDLVVQGLLAAR